MNFFRPILIKLLALSLIATSYTSQAQTSSLKEGDFLESSYLNSLLAKRSPFLAAQQHKQANSALVFLVSFKNGRSQFFGGNFHEGGADFSLDKVGKVKLSETLVQIIGPEHLPIRLKIIDERHFALQGKQFYKDYYWVGKSQYWVAKKLLVGRYQLANKELISFSAQQVSLPIGKFYYEVGLDPIIPYDYIVLKKAPKARELALYRFKLVGKQLFLYETAKDNEYSLPKKISWQASKLVKRQACAEDDEEITA